MRILVSGGAGFIGSHLCEELLRQGHTVVAIDNLITGRTVNLESFIDHPNFTYYRHDVVNPLPGMSGMAPVGVLAAAAYNPDLYESPMMAQPGTPVLPEAVPSLDLRFDAIFNLASPASPIGYGKHPIETMLTNSAGTYNMLLLALRNNAKFLLTSTSEAYGDPEIHPQTEDYWGHVNPNGPRACYDESKRFSEAISMEFVRQYGLDGRIVRIFNTYGPRNDPTDGRVVPNFICQVLRDEPMTIYGDGSQTRSFCYVTDLVDGLLRAMFTPGTTGDVFNLGNPEEHTIYEFGEIIAAVAGQEPQFEFKPLPKDDPTRRKPDITRARTRLGWEPRVKLTDGLRETMAWYKTQIFPVEAEAEAATV